MATDLIPAVIITTVVCLCLIPVIYWFSRNISGPNYPPVNLNLLFRNIDYEMHRQGWVTKPNFTDSEVIIQKNSLVATKLIFSIDNKEEVGTWFAVVATKIGWIIILILCFLGGYGTIPFAIYLHIKSRKFAKREVIPAILRRDLRGPHIPPPVKAYP